MEQTKVLLQPDVDVDEDNNDNNSNGVDPTVINAYVGRCACTERQVTLGFFLMATIAALASLAIFIFARTIVKTRDWLFLKRLMKRRVKVVAASTAMVSQHIANSAGQDSSAPADVALGSHPLMLQWLDSVETASALPAGYKVNGTKGWFFIIDSRNTVWAHGKTPHLCRDGWGRRLAAVHSLDPLDAPSGQRSTPDNADMPINAMQSIAKMGGGFCKFKWKRQREHVAYLYPVAGPNGLVVGGVLPMPY